ncbi:MFS transporter [Plantibacter sp. YIM 135347]|uniref:MFS transporter n=1 Tax=Plantibacter sp. YIM 135347 TaxID=3423919 RepID=UPI003D35021B
MRGGRHRDGGDGATDSRAGATPARRRFLLLTALRWVPTGLVAPVITLLAVERGLTIAEVGVIVAVQGFVVLGAELPAGTLSDAIGRRPTLILAGVTGVCSIVLVATAQSFAMFVVAFALQGVWRALDSGTLESWYVDRVVDDGDGTGESGGAGSSEGSGPDIASGLAAGATVLNLAMGAGALASGGVVAVGLAIGTRPFGVSALVLPVVVAAVLTVVSLVAVILLVTEERPVGGRPRLRGLWKAIPFGIVDGVRLVTRSRVLLALVAVELCWGFGMVAFETLMPLRLGEVVGSATEAGALMGPVTSVAWLAAAAGAALVPLASRRWGTVLPAAGLRVLQGLTVVGMGLLAGPVGVIGAFVACYGVHGASNPLHNALLHRQATNANRAVVLSINSMAAQPAFAIGALVLGAIASGASLGVAMVVAGVVLALAAPLYLPARRQELQAA